VLDTYIDTYIDRYIDRYIPIFDLLLEVFKGVLDVLVLVVVFNGCSLFSLMDNSRFISLTISDGLKIPVASFICFSASRFDKLIKKSDFSIGIFSLLLSLFFSLIILFLFCNCFSIIFC
jgi:hypothetical protein